MVPAYPDSDNREKCAQASRVPLEGGGFAVIDREDVERIAGFTWYPEPKYGGKYVYAKASRLEGGKWRTVYLHRFITGAGKGTHVDHINGDTLDNRKCNLRVCSPGENLANRQSLNANSTTGYRGVYRSRSGKYYADITVKYRRIYLGTFKTAEEAGRARDAATIEHFGEHGYLNFPEEHGREISS